MRLTLAVAIFGALSVGCNMAAPDAGTEAVLIRKPIIFGHGGVDQTPVKPGREFVALTTDVVYVEMRPQRVNVQFDDLMSKDGVPLDFDASIRYRITNSVQCVEKFGCDEGMIGRNLADPFRKFVRDAVKRRGMNETAIDASAAEAIDAEVTEATKAYVKTIGLPVELIDVTVGRANPPDAIKNQRVETATQEQRINTERQRKLAEDQRKDAEVSRAAADNAYREAMRLSPEQFLALESIHAQRDICAKGGCTFVAPGLSTSTVVGMR